MSFAPDTLPKRESRSHGRRRVKTKIVTRNGTTVIVDHDGQPWSSGLPIPAEQKDTELCMIRLPDRICSCCLPPVNKIKAFAIRFAAMMREGQKAAGNLTNQIIDSAVAGESLTCGLGKLSNLRQMDRMGNGGLSSASPSIAALIFGETTLRAPRSSLDLRASATSPSFRY
jgi:hypothetical protein